MTDPVAPSGFASDRDFELARRAMERGWVTREQIEEALLRREKDPSLKLLECLPLAAEQREELRGPGTTRLPREVAEAMAIPERRMGKYVVVRQLGAGGMGVVLKAYDRQLCRWSALKFMKVIGDDRAKAYFEREARLAAGLLHENIAAIYEVGQHQDQPYIAMQYVEGDNLHAVFPRMARAHLLRCMRDVARAVHHAHTKGVIHRDIKPANIMLDMEGKVWVMDFGLAKQMQVEGMTAATSSSLVLGTPAYMAPEQARGELHAVNERSDVYSLGASLYHVLCGHPPFEGDTAASTLVKLLQEEAPPLRLRNPSVPRELETLVMKCLEKSPERRYPSALELAADLERFLNHEPIRAHAPSLFYRARKGLRRHGALVTILLLAGVAVVGGSIVGVQYWRGEAERRRREAEERRLREAEEIRRSNQYFALRPQAEEAYRREEWTRAYEAYRELLALVPEDREFRLRMAEVERELRVRDYEARKRSVEKSAIEPVLRRLAQLGEGEEAWAEGVALLDGALAKSRESEQGWYERGRLSYRLGRFAEAEGDFKRAAALARVSADAHYWRGKALVFLDRDAEAAAEFERCAQLDPQGALGTLSRAYGALLRDQTAEAVEILNRAEESGTAKSMEDLYLIRALGRLSAWNEAAGNMPGEILEDFARAAERSPGCLDPYLRVVGMLYGRAGSPEAAERLFGQALVRRPRNPSIFLARAQFRESFSNIAGAIADYGEALALGATPDGETSKLFDLSARIYIAKHPEKYRLRPSGGKWDVARLQRLLSESLIERAQERKRLQDFKGAVEDLDEAIELDESSAEALTERGLILLELGKRAEARKDLEAAIRADRKSISAIRALATLKKEDGDWKGALADYEAAHKLHPKNLSLISDLAHLQSELQEFEAVIATSDAGLALDPKNHWLHLMRGWAKSELGRHDEALQDLNEAVTLAPNDAQNREFRGVTKLAMGDVEAALADFEAAIRLNPERPGPYARRGNVRLDRKADDLAREDFERAIKLDPDRYEGHSGMARLLHRRGDKEAALRHARRCEEIAPFTSAELGDLIRDCEDAVHGVETVELLALPADAGLGTVVCDDRLERFFASTGTRVFDGATAAQEVDLAYGFQFAGPHGFYLAERQGKGFVVRDGRALDAFDSVGWAAASADGQTFAYDARSGDERFVVINGRRQKSYDFVSHVTVSPDGQTVAYVANVGGTPNEWGVGGGRNFVVCGGDTQGEFDSVKWLSFLPDGRTPTFVASRAGKEFLVEGSREHPAFDYVGEPVRSPDGRGLAYAAREGAAMFVVHQGARGASYDWVGTPVFRADGRSIAYRVNRGGDGKENWTAIGGKFAVVVNSRVGKWYDHVQERVVFVGLSDRVAYAANVGGAAGRDWMQPVEGGRWCLVSGEREGGSWDTLSDFEVSPDGRSAAYQASRGAGRSAQTYLVHDDKSVPVEGVRHMTYSADGRWLAYAATQTPAGGARQLWGMYVNHVRRTCGDRIWAVRFGVDGRSLLAVAEQAGKLVRKRIPLPD